MKSRRKDHLAWIESEPAERAVTLRARRSAFRPRKIPLWFRRRVLGVTKDRGWGYPPGGYGGWQVLQVLRGRLPSGGPGFEHCGTYGEAFVSQAKMPLDQARAFAATVAGLLGIDFELDDLAPRGKECLWIEWMLAKWGE